MKVTRKNVFETNSSSMHTLTVPEEWNLTNYHIDSEIEVWPNEYGWFGDPCSYFDSKLAYAISMVLHTEYPGFNQYDKMFEVDQDILEDLQGYKILIDAIRKHGRCEKIVVGRFGGYYPYGYIDHQSYEHYHSLQDFLDDWDVDAERFLFDDGVTVWIDNDNH